MSIPFTCLDASWLERLGTGQLTPEERSQVSTHLEHCPSCAERAKALDASVRTAAYTPSPVPAMDADLPPTIGRYPIEALIGQGGMGVVYRGRDGDLRRALAIKVLRPEHADDTTLQQRFLKEAQIMGQLQHPGVAPIHEIGKLADGRPFFSMKQIQGQTFAALLKERRSPTDNLATHIATFAQVCQTLAYAHSRGIIHRDLKPANIMVGAFGEVQVMDWGLAKVLDEQDVAAADTRLVEVEATVAGTVLGTYAYMAPEQARGDVEHVDARSDVFGLGAILCGILTGQPPYAKANERRRQAAAADLGDALARLAACAADGELVDLARCCLAVERERRPADAGAIAETLARYQSQVQQRLRQAELDRTAAQVKAAEERKRRRVSAALFGVALLLVVVVGGATLWYVLDQAARAEERARQAERQQQLETALAVEDAQKKVRHEKVAAALSETERLLKETDRHLADPIETAKLLSNPEQRWKKALLDPAQADWDKASALAGSKREGLDPALKARLEELAGKLQQSHRGWKRAKVLDEIRMEASILDHGQFGSRKAGGKYAAAFVSWGMNPATEPPKTLALRIADDPLRYVLVAALDHWAGFTKDVPLLERLLEVARIADPDPGRDQVRSLDVWVDGMQLGQLTGEVDPKRHSPHLLAVLAMKSDLHNGIVLLRQALIIHPQDFWLHFQLGQAVKAPGEKVGCFRATVAIRPESAVAWTSLAVELHGQGNVNGAIAAYHQAIAVNPKDAKVHYNLGVALKAKGDVDGAINAWRQAIACDPKHANAHFNLGSVLQDKGDVDGAIAAYGQATACDPKDAKVHYNLGVALKAKGDVDGAINAYRQGIACDPKHANAHNNLGLALYAKKDVGGAIAAYRQAIACDPKHANAHLNLGGALHDKGDVDGAIAAYRQGIACNPKDANAHFMLGLVLGVKSDLDGAIDAYRQAIDCNPKHADAHFMLGLVLGVKGDQDGAIDAYRQAIACNPKHAKAQYKLGNALGIKGDGDGAIAAYRQAIACDPKNAKAHNELGWVLYAKKDVDGAIAAYRQAIACNPKDADAHYNLGVVLRAKGDLDGAITAYRQAIACNPKHAQAHHNLGSILYDKKDVDGAIAAYRQAIAADPQFAKALDSLGVALYATKDLDGAAAVYRQAIACNPKDANAHHNLGLVLHNKGDVDGAIAAYHQAIAYNPKLAFAYAKLGVAFRARGQLKELIAAFKQASQLLPNHGGIRQDLNISESRWVDREKRLPAILAGTVKPGSALEAVEFAQLCFGPTHKYYALALNLYQQAFASDKQLESCHRYHAACAAVMLAAGKDATVMPTPQEAADIRLQAHGWLLAQLGVVRKTAASATQYAQEQLAHWKKDANLASVRDAAALRELPRRERQLWQRFWCDVDQLLAQLPAPAK